MQNLVCKHAYIYPINSHIYPHILLKYMQNGAQYIMQIHQNLTTKNETRWKAREIKYF